MVTVMADELRTLVAGIMRSKGVPERDSETIASSLVFANLRGIDSHGVIRVSHYAKRLDNGSINAVPNAVFERTGAATGVLHGDNGMGHANVRDAADNAIEIARESGVGIVGVTDSSHCGALSFFAHRMIDAGMVCMVFSQTDKYVVPFGGKEPFCGTNPLCFAAPSRTGAPIILDMATSTVALGQVIKARGQNKPIPNGWAVDEEGNSTTDPHAAKWLSPAAGPKGYGLGVIVDVLTGILCGGAFGPHITAMYGDYEQRRGLCHLVAVIDYQRFPGSDTFLDTVTAMISELHDVPPAPGFDRVLAPGEPEYLRQAERSEQGIPLEDYIWQELLELSGKQGR